MLSATTILEGIYFEFENLKPMDPWIERVVELLQGGVRPPTREDELRANSVVMMGATFRAPVHSMLESCLRRVLDLLNEPFASNLKIAAAGMLHAYSNVAMDAQAERMASIIARPLLEANDVSPQRAIFYWTAEGYSHRSLLARYRNGQPCRAVLPGTDAMLCTTGPLHRGNGCLPAFARALVGYLGRRALLHDPATVRRIAIAQSGISITAQFVICSCAASPLAGTRSARSERGQHTDWIQMMNGKKYFHS